MRNIRMFATTTGTAAAAAAAASGSASAPAALVVTGRSARTQRLLRGGRPVVRAVLMTTAVAWSLGAVRIPEAEANSAAPMFSVSVGETGAGAGGSGSAGRAGRR